VAAPSELEWLVEPRPVLQRPVLLVALEGLFDVAGVATDALEWLTDGRPVETIAAIDPDGFYDFTQERPQVRLEDDERVIDWPENEFKVVRFPSAGRDLVVLSGVEPHIRWSTFADHVIDVARATRCELIVTAGGVTAWQDLALHLIARLCGPEHAIRTAKVYLLGGHEDGQLPFSAISQPRRLGDSAIRRSLDWIDANIAAPNPVMAMAECSGLTRRTFARRFRTATGKRPIEYVHALRIERARQLIEAGASPIDDVGYQVGYEDPTFFRRLFRRAIGLTPAAYRRKYATIVPLPVAQAATEIRFAG